MLTSQRSRVKQSFFVKKGRRIRPRLRLFLLCFLPFLCAFFTFPVAFVAGPLLHSFTCRFKSSGSWLRRSSPVLKQKEVERGEENELSVNAAGDPASGSCAGSFSDISTVVRGGVVRTWRPQLLFLLPLLQLPQF